MNLVLLLPEDFCPGCSEGDQRVRLSGRRFEHVLRIQRAKLGDELCVGRIGGGVGRGRVVLLDEFAFEMEVRLDGEPPEPLPATLLLALPRPLVLKRVLVAATSMGVKRIVLLGAHRVEKSFWQSHVLTPEALREQLVLGLEQARDTRLPEVWQRRRFRPFVEDELPGLVEGKLALVAHPEAEASCPRDVRRPTVLAVGPEGGWTDHEISSLVACGFSPVGLGQRPLRVETAIPAILSRLY